MPIPIREVIGTLADNLRLRGSVMPLGRRRATGWAKGLGIPRGGDTVLYTGHMYQLMPSTAAMEAQMSLIKDSPLVRYMWLGRLVNRYINTTRLMPGPPAAAQRVWDNRLRNIVRLLRAAGVSFGYLYEKELYAGALVCDQGMDEVFQDHARRVHDMLRREGVRSVITVDPHTTDMLRTVYPKILPGFDIAVKSYLEVLAERGMTARRALGEEAVVHDSCVYARYENVVDEPRTLLSGAGVTLREQDASRKLTQCCGGPIESLFPDKAKEIAATRVGQLRASGCGNIVAMCPICLLNLERAAPEGTTVSDISDVLVRAYCADAPEEAAVPAGCGCSCSCGAAR